VPGGIPGVETRLPLGYTTGVRGGRLTLSRFVDIWSTGPARAFGLYPRKGLIAVGSDADLTLIDPAKTSMLRASELNMNSDCLPYEGWEVYGWPVTTILRGQVIAMDGSLVSQKPEGMLIPRYLQ
jgi:dihydropyrimidinase